MALKKIDPTDAGMAALISEARAETVILQTEEAGDFAVLPLDEDVIDLLLERSPALIEECGQIRERMRQGRYLTHQQVLQALQADTKASP